MRRPSAVALMLGVLALGSVVAVIAFRASSHEAPSSTGPTPVAARPSTPREPTPPPRGTLSIRGRVLREDQSPAGGVEVSATRSIPGESLSGRPCGKDTETPLSSAQCEDLRTLLEVIDEGSGAAPVVGQATTAEDGSFTLEGLAEGTVALWALSPRGATVNLTVATGTQDVTLVLAREIRGQGRVIDEAARPVVNATVTLFHLEHSRYFEVFTDKDGRFALGPLPQGDYTLVIFSPGMLPLHVPDLFLENLHEEELVLHRPRSIVGQVLQDERPVAGAQVETHDAWYRQVTDAQGRFTLENLYPGRFILWARHGDQQGEVVTELEEEQDRVEVTVRLGTLFRVMGTVRDEAGKPVADALVEMNGAEDVIRTRPAHATTKEDGTFVLDHAPQGPMSFSAWAEGFQQSEPQGQVVTADLPPLDFVLKRAFVVEGIVTDAEGKPLAEALVTGVKRTNALRPRHEKPPESPYDLAGTVDSYTNEQGRFLLSLTEPGIHIITPEADGFLGTSVEVEAPARDVKLVMNPGARLQGLVVDARGEPIPEVTLTLWDGKEKELLVSMGPSDEHGRFSVGGLPSGGPFSLKAEFEVGGIHRTSVPVELRDTETTKVTVRMDTGLSVSGVVVDEAGVPVADVGVHGASLEESNARSMDEESPSDSVVPSIATTDAQGRFTLHHVPPGACRLMIQKQGYVLRGDPATDSEPLPHDPRVIVPAGAKDVRLVLLYQGSIRGRLMREDYSPITRFNINEEPRRDPLGAFRVPVDPPGNMTLTLEAPGLTRLVREVHVEPGQDVDLGDVVLKAGRRVRGRVLDARTSQPVVGVEIEASTPPASTPVRDPEAYVAPLANVSTGAGGVFELPPLEHGPLLLKFLHPEYLSHEEHIGPADTELETRLSSGARLAGTVVDRRGRPVQSHVEIKPLSPQNEATRYKYTRGRQGAFSASGLMPGDYSVVPSEAENVEGDTVSFIPRLVSLGPSESKTLQFQERVGQGALKLRLVEPGRSPEDPFGGIAFIKVHLFPGPLPAITSRRQWDQLSQSLAVPRLEDPMTLEEHLSFSELPLGRYTFAMRGTDVRTRQVVLHREEVEVSSPGVITIDLRPRWVPLAEP
ncbi:carboxypeptidase-like regulatory domain-containing protein [Myxococcus landrumensis]|uniref:Carboxypeptidase regulatory-like domain-containing protein n=1 Tax=Myxococcus landrumensis TaxID=2813577 RepID=A0ABX7N371_9BACT|nr:carboxypeptidase-like regulatory domain-containing protein [Myxococcus landrumus]QSQ11836.1 carboxypeptidase regulatory-like domain-containing protein [Myxococcus landrumus]